MPRHISNFIALITTFLITTFLPQPVSAADNPQTPGKYQIGVILPLSGAISSYGTYLKRGIDLAYNQLSPEARERIEVIFEDDQFDPVKTVSAYNKLKNSNGVDAVFVFASPPANALGPILEKDKKILIAIGASDPSIALGKQYSFIHWVIPPVLASSLSEEIIRRDFKKLAFIAAEASGAIADVDAAIDVLKKNGRGDRIVYRQTFLKEETDFRTPISQLRQKQVDGIVLVLFPGGLSAFAKQAKSNKLPAELIGMETFEDEAEVKAASGALNGSWYVNASDPTPDFIKEHQEAYGVHPGWGSCNSYDSLELVAKAVSSVGKDNEKIRDFLRSIKDYSGACGVYSASGDNRFTLPASLKKVTADGFQPLETTRQ